MKCPECLNTYDYEEDDANDYLCEQCAEMKKFKSWAVVSAGLYAGFIIFIVSSCASWNAILEAEKVVDHSVASRIERSSEEIARLNREIGDCKKKSSCTKQKERLMRRELDDYLKGKVKKAKKTVKKIVE